jgi:hypothetical protein
MSRSSSSARSATTPSWLDSYCANTARGEYRFHLKAANGEIIAVSKAYDTMASAKNGVFEPGAMNSQPVCSILGAISPLLPAPGGLAGWRGMRRGKCSP